MMIEIRPKRTTPYFENIVWLLVQNAIQRDAAVKHLGTNHLLCNRPRFGANYVHVENIDYILCCNQIRARRSCNDGLAGRCMPLSHCCIWHWNMSIDAIGWPPAISE